MFRNRFSVTALAVAVAFAASGSPVLAQSSPVLGSWETITDTPLGKLGARITFARNGDAYTVDIKDAPPPASADGAPAPAGPPESRISDVVVSGNSFSFKRSLTTEQGPILLAYAGKVEGDTLTAEAKSDFGAVPITGSRVP